MTITSTVRKMFSDYRRKFDERKDGFTFYPSRRTLSEDMIEEHDNDEDFDDEDSDRDVHRKIEMVHKKGFVTYNSSAYRDLEIDDICIELESKIPFGTNRSSDYLKSVVRRPLLDLGDLAFRQNVMSELFENTAIRERAKEVKSAGDDFKYENKYNNSDSGFADQKLQYIESAKLLVDFVDKVKTGLSDSKSVFLKDIVAFVEKLDKDSGFQTVRSFIKNVYEPEHLGDAINFIEKTLHRKHLEDVNVRRNFFANTNILAESLEALLKEDDQKEFISSVEGRAVSILESFKDRSKFYNKNLFKFEGDLSGFQYNNNHNFLEMTQYIVALIHEAVSAKFPKVDIKDLPEELGTYIAMAELQQQWKDSGVNVTLPVLLDKTQRKTVILDSYNTTLIGSLKPKSVQPNDVISDPKHNIFVIEGPNNGGKTTYIRQVGQMYWVAQLGMWIPAQKAEISVVDGIYSSIGSEDNTNAGTGQYLTELNRVCEFTKPSNGKLHTTPYSLLFFDEFANGTDHEEAVYRTRVVLDHLSQKGVTAYFTTHKHEIGTMVENKKIRGALNLASEVKKNGQGIITTHRIVRDAREESYGNIIAESLGITPDALNAYVRDELKRGIYKIEDTRLKN